MKRVDIFETDTRDDGLKVKTYKCTVFTEDGIVVSAQKDILGYRKARIVDKNDDPITGLTFKKFVRGLKRKKLALV